MAIEYKIFFTEIENARPAIPLTTPQRRDVVTDPLDQPIVIPNPATPEKTPGNPVEKPNPVRDPATVPA